MTVATRWLADLDTPRLPRSPEMTVHRRAARATGDLAIEAALDRVRRHGAAQNWLAVLVTTRPAGADPSVSLVKAGVLAHPVHGRPVLAFVARGATAKLANLRRRARATLTFHDGWEWVAVTGTAELAGPDDPLDGLAAGALPGLLREVFHAAGGHHDDLAAYDAAMAAERRTVVLVDLERFATNPPGTGHVER